MQNILALSKEDFFRLNAEHWHERRQALKQCDHSQTLLEEIRREALLGRMSGPFAFRLSEALWVGVA